MHMNEILESLVEERDRLDSAIAALRGDGVKRSYTRRTPADNGRKAKRHMSAAARKKISEAAKRRWAKVKAST